VSINNKKIQDLVEENYVFASVLYYLGIQFYDYKEDTLDEVCKKRGLNLQQVLNSLEAVTRENEEHNLTLTNLPVDIIIEYLKHSHFVFIKQKLPYIARLIKNIKTEGPIKHLADDLQVVFPLFVEDFIRHIYAEEDTLFSYILELNKIVQEKTNPGKMFLELEKRSIQHFAIEHDAHDDEMEGMRRITKDYTLGKDSDLHLHVVYEELKSFEKQLIHHASIEDEILFPKALMLEKEVRRMIGDKVKFN
jgi:regulator of cell morphogenesis and NO signaling